MYLLNSIYQIITNDQVANFEIIAMTCYRD